MLLILFVIISLFAGAVLVFVKTAPQIGQAPQGPDLERLQNSSNYRDGGFLNLIDTRMGSFQEMMGTLPKFIYSPGGEPSSPLSVAYGENEEPATDSAAHLTWFGHSAFLLEMDDLRILIDPMLGPVASPVRFGSKRFPNEKPIPMNQLKDIDVVIVSHDHYDHLDYTTVREIKDEVQKWYTPLGVGSHLKKWGVHREKIVEMDWWDRASIQQVQLIATPARHFSGRGFSDRNATQWASWVIRGSKQQLYFSGDSGYGPHFGEIGERFGPFDLAMLECGQYNEAWAQIHMMPEESVQAGIDVGGQALDAHPLGWFQAISTHLERAYRKIYGGKQTPKCAHRPSPHRRTLCHWLTIAEDHLVDERLTFPKDLPALSGPDRSHLDFTAYLNVRGRCLKQILRKFSH